MTVETSAVSFWDTLDPYAQCRVSALVSTPQDYATPAPPGIGRSMGPGRLSSRLHAKQYHPDNPLFWFAAFGLVTAGAMVLSTGAGARVHAGPAKADLELEGREED